MRWYEVVKGAFYEVWLDGDRPIGDIEVLARAVGAPRIYGGTVATPKSQYRGTHLGSGRSFVTDDIYDAVKRLAELERDRSPHAVAD